MSYSEFDTAWVECPLESPETALHNTECDRLYETDDEAQSSV
jgi:hypothetical protein